MKYIVGEGMQIATYMTLQNKQCFDSLGKKLSKSGSLDLLT